MIPNSTRLWLCGLGVILASLAILAITGFVAAAFDRYFDSKEGERKCSRRTSNTD